MWAALSGPIFTKTKVKEQAGIGWVMGNKEAVTGSADSFAARIDGIHTSFRGDIVENSCGVNDGHFHSSPRHRQPQWVWRHMVRHGGRLICFAASKELRDNVLEPAILTADSQDRQLFPE